MTIATFSIVSFVSASLGACFGFMICAACVAAKRADEIEGFAEVEAWSAGVALNVRSDGVTIWDVGPNGEHLNERRLDGSGLGDAA
jgi:hypothetical protein